MTLEVKIEVKNKRCCYIKYNTLEKRNKSINS